MVDGLEEPRVDVGSLAGTITEDPQLIGHPGTVVTPGGATVLRKGSDRGARHAV